MQEPEVSKRKIESMLFGDSGATEAEIMVCLPPLDEEVPKKSENVRRSSFGSPVGGRRRFGTVKKGRSASLQPSGFEVMRREIAVDREILKSPVPRATDSDVAPRRFVKSSESVVVVCVGASMTGKTQFLETLTKGSTRLRPPPTMGLEKFHVRDVLLWDTSGDERFLAAISGILSVADAVMAFYDPKRSETLEVALKRLDDAPMTSDKFLVATGTLGPHEKAHADSIFLGDPTDATRVNDTFNDVRSRLDSRRRQQRGGKQQPHKVHYYSSKQQKMKHSSPELSSYENLDDDLIEELYSDLRVFAALTGVLAVWVAVLVAVKRIF